MGFENALLNTWRYKIDTMQTKTNATLAVYQRNHLMNEATAIHYDHPYKAQNNNPRCSS